MSRFHWQQAASAASINESGTDYLYWVGFCQSTPSWRWPNERKFAQTLGSIAVTDLATLMEAARRVLVSRVDTKGNRALRRIAAGSSLFFR
jgi:hypothetical protein